jgi:hypothetical protein
VRSSEPGYILAAMNDPSGRRGIWYRESPVDEGARPLTKIEICGGRGGDDCYISLAIGDVVSPDTLRSLEQILSRGAWMVREAEAQADRDRYMALSDEDRRDEDEAAPDEYGPGLAPVPSMR